MQEGSYFCVGKVISLEKAMAPHSSTLPRKSHGWRSLVSCSPWGHYKSDTTERLHFHFPLSCIGEGNGNPLQCSCLENPRERGAWRAAVYGVAQSRTRLRRLSSSSSSSTLFIQGRNMTSRAILYVNNHLLTSEIHGEYNVRGKVFCLWRGNAIM